MSVVEIGICVLICGIFACLASVGDAVRKLRACIADLQESHRLSWSTEDALTRRLNVIESRFDASLHKLENRVQKLAADTEAHEANIEILRFRTNHMANPLLWRTPPDAEPKLGAPHPYGLTAEYVTGHRTDDPSQERDDTQDTASSLYVTPPGFDPVVDEPKCKTLPSDDYRVFCRLTSELHELIRDGRGDSTRAREIRDICDRHWNGMAEFEKAAAREFSENLYGTPPCPPTDTSTGETAQ